MYRLEIDAEKRVIHSWISTDFNLKGEFETYLREVKGILDQANGPTIFVSDLREYQVNLGDVTGVLGIMTRGDLAVLNHPSLYKTIVITENPMIRFGTSALGQNQYGSLRVAVVRSPEEASALIEKDLQDIQQ